MSRPAKGVNPWAAVWIVAALLLVPAPHPALAQGKEQPRENGAERNLFDAANRERAARRLPLLKWDEMLGGAAREHALLMAERNTISHQFPGEPDFSARIKLTGVRFQAAAENVAEGPSVAGLHTQWMNSPPHRANLLDPKLNSLGVAVAERNGQFFAVEDFSQTVSDLSLEEQERQVGAQLQRRGLRLMNDAGDARRFCKTQRGDDIQARPSYAMRYSAADLMNLPAILAHELDSGRFHAAAIGACSTGQSNDDFGYHLAVLLYK